MLSESSESCEICRFFSKNIKKKLKEEKFRLPHCSLRRILIKRSPFWAYCKNCRSNEDDPPAGNVYLGEGFYPSGRKVWLNEKDQVRLFMEQATLASFCRDKLPLSDPQVGSKFTYPNLPLCVIDTVLSISMSHKHTKQLAARFIERFYMDGEPVRKNGEGQTGTGKDLGITDLIDTFHQYGIENISKEFLILHPKYIKGGILRANVVLKFSQVLLDFGVNTLADIEKAIGNPELEAALKKIIGLKNGLAINHFYILVGAGDYVKPDRMIQRFVRTLIGRNVKADYCHQLLFGACLILADEFPNLNSSILDHLIWQYESER